MNYASVQFYELGSLSELPPQLDVGALYFIKDTHTIFVNHGDRLVEYGSAPELSAIVPISRGGTGATTLEGALSALGVRAIATTAATDAVNAEAALRSSADTLLSNRITTETSQRQTSDTQFAQDISTERQRATQAEQNLQDKINNLTGQVHYIAPNNFGTATPTAAALTAWAKQHTGQTYVESGTSCVNLYDNHEWIADGKGQWFDIGNVAIPTATNNVLGLVKGSSADMGVSVGNGGVMTANVPIASLTKLGTVTSNTKVNGVSVGADGTMLVNFMPATGILPIANGGTGASSADQVMTSLGILSAVEAYIDANFFPLIDDAVSKEITESTSGGLIHQAIMNETAFQITNSLQTVTSSINAANTRINSISDELGARPVELPYSVWTHLKGVITDLSATKIKVDDSISSIESEVTRATTRENTLSDAIEAVNNVLTEEIVNRDTAIQDEAAARLQADAVMQSQIDSVTGKLRYMPANNFGVETPAQTDLSNWAMSHTGLDHVENGTCVINLFDNIEWIYDGTGNVWVNIGAADIAIATNSDVGVVMGSTVDWGVRVDSLGKMSIQPVTASAANAGVVKPSILPTAAVNNRYNTYIEAATGKMFADIPVATVEESGVIKLSASRTEAQGVGCVTYQDQGMMFVDVPKTSNTNFGLVKVSSDTYENSCTPCGTYVDVVSGSVLKSYVKQARAGYEAQGIVSFNSNVYGLANDVSPNVTPGRIELHKYASAGPVKYSYGASIANAMFSIPYKFVTVYSESEVPATIPEGVFYMVANNSTGVVGKIFTKKL